MTPTENEPCCQNNGLTGGDNPQDTMSFTLPYSPVFPYLKWHQDRTWHKSLRSRTARHVQSQKPLVLSVIPIQDFFVFFFFAIMTKKKLRSSKEQRGFGIVPAINTAACERGLLKTQAKCRKNNVFMKSLRAV